VITRPATLTNKRGLHARAAAKVVRLAEQFKAELWVQHNNQRVTARSIMGLMMLAAGPGSTVTLEAEGPQAEQALQSLADLIAIRFEEEA
jgi:phosphocarrier protein HPr